eukprot:738222-Amphidinium_carterae.1
MTKPTTKSTNRAPNQAHKEGHHQKYQHTNNTIQEVRQRYDFFQKSSKYDVYKQHGAICAIIFQAA